MYLPMSASRVLVAALERDVEANACSRERDTFVLQSANLLCCKARRKEQLHQTCWGEQPEAAAMTLHIHFFTYRQPVLEESS